MLIIYHIIYCTARWIFIHELTCQRLLQWEQPVWCCLWTISPHAGKQISATLYNTEKQRVDLHCCAQPLHSLSLSPPLSLSRSLFPFCFWRVTSVECASLISLDISLSSFAAYVSCLFSRLSQRSQAKPNIWILKSFSLIAEQSQKGHKFLRCICLNVRFDARYWAAVSLRDWYI